MERETLRISRSYCASTSTFSWNSIRKARFHEITCKGSKVEFKTRICSIAEEDIYCIVSSVVNTSSHARIMYQYTCMRADKTRPNQRSQVYRPPVASCKKLFERVLVASLKIYPKGIARSGGEKDQPEEWQSPAQHPHSGARERFSHPARFASFLLFRSQFE